ncbi:MAG: hypothetical protein E7574_02105 [Ruminococcaceae bacterium]|nr:hypothetical protein [Oscillospiraceae bacterium]
MKNFFKDGIDTIVKFLVTQLGMTMFGTMLTLTIAGKALEKDNKNTFMLILVSLVAIILYLYLIYVHVWEKGAKDRIKVDTGRMERQSLKGLYLSLVANSLNILLGLIMVISRPFCDFVNNSKSIACQIFGASNDIARIIQGMYNGLLIYISPNGMELSPIFFLLIPIPAIAVSTFGYLLGYSNRKISKFFKSTDSRK